MRDPEAIENEKRMVYAEVCVAGEGDRVAFHTRETEEEWIESDTVRILEDVR